MSMEAEAVRLRRELYEARLALDALLDHAERIQEHVPKSEHWYVVRDCARAALSAASTDGEEKMV